MAIILKEVTNPKEPRTFKDAEGNEITIPAGVEVSYGCYVVKAGQTVALPPHIAENLALRYTFLILGDEVEVEQKFDKPVKTDKTPEEVKEDRNMEDNVKEDDKKKGSSKGKK